MATIIRQERKSGINYRIQVAIKDPGSGKRITKTTTFNPPKDLTEREIQRELQKFALSFEEDCRRPTELMGGESSNITVKEYSEVWLDTLKQTASKAYYASCLRLMQDIIAQLGGYRLKELNPIIIQRFVDGLRKKEIITTVAIPTNLGKVVKKQNLSWNKLGILSGLSATTAKAASKGGRVRVESAEKLAVVLGVRVTEVFDIQRDVRPYKAESIAKIHRTLKAMLSFAKRQMIIPENYAKADFVKGIKPEKQSIKCMNLSEARHLLACVDKEQDIRKKAVINILLLMGIRRGECAGLEWKDIDFNDGTMTIARSSSNITGFGVVTGKPKSAHSRRTIDMPPSLVSTLKEYKIWWEQTTKALGDRYTGSDRLFLQHNGNPINPSTIRYWLKKLTEKYNLPDVSVHSLRHTNISIQLTSQLIPDKEVSARAGHGSTKVTKDIYWELFRQDGKDAAKAIDGLFGNN